MSKSCCSRLQIGDVIRVGLDRNGHLVVNSSSKRVILMFEERAVVDLVYSLPVVVWRGRPERIAHQYIFATKKKCTPASES
jgi:hypothetical protein